MPTQDDEIAVRSARILGAHLHLMERHASPADIRSRARDLLCLIGERATEDPGPVHLRYRSVGTSDDLVAAGGTPDWQPLTASKPGGDLRGPEYDEQPGIRTQVTVNVSDHWILEWTETSAGGFVPHLWRSDANNLPLRTVDLLLPPNSSPPTEGAQHALRRLAGIDGFAGHASLANDGWGRSSEHVSPPLLLARATLVWRAVSQVQRTRSGRREAYRRARRRLFGSGNQRSTGPAAAEACLEALRADLDVPPPQNIPFRVLEGTQKTRGALTHYLITEQGYSPALVQRWMAFSSEASATKLAREHEKHLQNRGTR